MIRKVQFPKISANIDEATITAWLREAGTRVAEGEPLVEITTDKGVVEVEAPCDGVLREIVAPENSTLPVGYVIALVGDPADLLPDVTEANAELLERHRNAVGKKAAGTRPARKGKRVRVRATPAARRLAREQGVDLADVSAATGADVVNERVLADYLERR